MPEQIPVIPDPGLQQVDPSAVQNWRMGAGLAAGEGSPLAPGQPPTYLQKYQQQVEGLGTEAEKREAEYQRRTQPLMSDISLARRDLGQAASRIPQQRQVGPPPDAAEFQKNAMGFASAMAVLGAVSSSFARVPASASLSAFAGALKGWKEGNLQAYNTAVDQWKNQTEQTITNNKQLIDKYKMVLENKKLNIDQMMAEMQLIAVENHHQVMYDAARSGNFTLAAKISDQMDRWTNGPDGLVRTYETNKAQADTVDQGFRQQAQHIIAAGGPEALRGQVNPKTGQPFTDAEILNFKYVVDHYGPQLKATGQPRSGPAMMMRKLIDENPNATAEELNAKWAELQGTVAATKVTAAAEPRADAATLTKLTQQRAAISSFEKTAIKNGEILKQLADKVDQTGVPAIERWIRSGRQSSGDPDVAKFHAQMQVYRAEVAKIITNPNLSGVLTDTARREVEGFMGGGASAKQIRAVVDLLEGDFGRRTQAIDEEINEVKSRLRGGKAAPNQAAAPAQPAQADPLGIR